jgi:protocatechuate 4,5-dioxygenase beta chain
MEPRLVDPAFDRRAVDWLARGDLDEACANTSFDQLKQSGNMTHGFLNFLLAAGLANGQRPVHAEGLEVGFPAVPMFAWEPEAVA